MTEADIHKPENQRRNAATLSCREAEGLISEALDRRLQANLDRALRKHIFSCPSCRKVYQDTLALQALVQRQPEDQVSPDFMEVLEERIAAGEGTPPAALDSPIPLSRKLKLFSSGMGTAAALLLSAWLIMDEITPPSNKTKPMVVQAGNPDLAAARGTDSSMGLSGNKWLGNNSKQATNPRPASPIPFTQSDPFQGTMRSVGEGQETFGEFPSMPIGRGHPLSPLQKYSSEKVPSKGLQPEDLGKFRRPSFPTQAQILETKILPSEVDMLDPSRFALGLFRGTLQSLEDLKTNTDRFQHFPPHKATQEILRAAEEARDCTNLLLKLDRRLLDLNPANEAWLKKVQKQLQKVTALGLVMKSNGANVQESLKRIRNLVKGIQTKNLAKTRVTIRLKLESNLRDSLLGTGMPPPSLQRVLKVLSRSVDGGSRTPGSFLFFNGGDLRIFVIPGKQK